MTRYELCELSATTPDQQPAGVRAYVLLKSIADGTRLIAMLRHCEINLLTGYALRVVPDRGVDDS